MNQPDGHIRPWIIREIRRHRRSDLHNAIVHVEPDGIPTVTELDVLATAIKNAFTWSSGVEDLLMSVSAASPCAALRTHWRMDLALPRRGVSSCPLGPIH